MSMKRDQPDEDRVMTEDALSQPLQKKTKVSQSLEGLSTKQSRDELQTKNVRLDTKSGITEKAFLVRDLHTLDYFRNLSASSVDETTIVIKNHQLSFGVEEIQALLDFKSGKEIRRSHPYQRLLFFCDACDYFAVVIDEEKFSVFLTNCIPSITPSQLSAFSKQCSGSVIAFHSFHSESKKLLQSAIQKRIQNDKHIQKKLHQKFIAKWRSIDVKMMTCNHYIAVAIFTANFKLHYAPARVPKYITCTSVPRVYVIQLVENCKKLEDIRMLWQYLFANKSWKRYPSVSDAIKHVICGLKSDLGTLTMLPNRITLFIDILVDVSYLICTGDVDLPLETLVNNVCGVLPLNSVVYFISSIQEKLGQWTAPLSERVFAALGKSLSAWFTACWPSMEQWMLTEFVEKIARPNIESLLELVCDQVVTHGDPKRISAISVEFLNKYGDTSLDKGMLKTDTAEKV